MPTWPTRSPERGRLGSMPAASTCVACVAGGPSIGATDILTAATDNEPYAKMFGVTPTMMGVSATVWTHDAEPLRHELARQSLMHGWLPVIIRQMIRPDDA